MAQRQKDPYRALSLPHSASAAEIKAAYRAMARKYHPDRYVGAEAETQQQAASRFADGAAAYALLSDPQRKASYDHIYKYGGFDNSEEEDNTNTGNRRKAAASSSSSNPSRKRRTGIGYNCVDPFSFVWTRGRIQSRHTTAGIEIPTRANHMSGLRFAFSSGQVVRGPSGVKTCVSQTTGFANGQKFSRTERIIYHPDGRKEVEIKEGDAATTADPFFEPQNSRSVSHSNSSNKPWYANAWDDLREKLSMCHNPCAAVTSH